VTVGADGGGARQDVGRRETFKDEEEEDVLSGLFDLFKEKEEETVDNEEEETVEKTGVLEGVRSALVDSLRQIRSLIKG